MNKVINYIKYNIYSMQDKIFSSRTTATIVLLLLCNIMFTTPIINYAREVGYSVNVTVLPFFLSSLDYMCILIPIIIYYFSGVPYLKYSEMYCIIREGKTKWVIKQIIHLIAMAFIFMIILEITSVIPAIINGNFSNEWNEVTSTLSLTDKWQEYNTVEFIYEIIEKFTPYSSMIFIFFFVGLIIAFFAIFLFTVSLLCSRIIAICAGFLFEGLVITAFNARFFDNYLIYCSIFSWTDITIFGKKYDGFFYPHGTPAIGWCTGFLIIGIVIMIIIDIIRVNKMNINYINED